MAAEQHPGSGPVPLTPLADTEALPAIQRATVWPRRLGVVSIILGSLGLLFGTMGSSVALQAKAIEMSLPQDVTPNQQAILKAATWRANLSIGAAAIGVPLLIAGIGLVARRRWSIKFCRAWTILCIVLSLVDAAVNALIHKGLAEAADRPATLLSTGVVLGLVWSLALPIFMLIWLAREEIREEIAGWR
jgi:hypothetical protein